MREPYWRTEKKEDWGLTPLNQYDWIKDVLSLPKQLLHLFLNNFHKKRINRVLYTFDIRRISLGSGATVPDGWIGFDSVKYGKNIFPVNLLLGIPVSSNSVHEILAEHIMEHFFFDDVYWILGECYRVLAPGGKIRIVSPDAKNIAKLILKDELAEKNSDVLTDAKIHKWPNDNIRWARYINRLSHQWGQHKSLLTSNMLKQILEKLGFDKVSQVSIKESVVFKKPPDIHYKRFPDDSPDVNFAIEAIVNYKEKKS